ncbi:MAG: hypothetical protein P1V21_12460 [Rhizobiaceae bacterium]|nr:hypothetical protein [Rhizobiaceae bacterium]
MMSNDKKSDMVERLVQIAQPGVPCTNPIVAASEALRAFEATRISVLTPNTDTVNEALADSFQAEGFEILNIEGFGQLFGKDLAGR